ncbi:tRNA 5-carboxymethoxyuridine methyltransferase [subsurface metagenome]
MEILRRIRKANLARRIASILGSEFICDLAAVTEKRAMEATINATSAEMFAESGMRLANELKARMPDDAVALDFGCGIGRPEKFLAPFCREIHGVDISRGMLRIAKRRHKGISNVYFHKNKAHNLSIFRDSTFDFAFSVAVLSHMNKEQVVLLLGEFYRVLKENGKIFLQFYNLLYPPNLSKFIAESKAKVHLPTHPRYWLPEEVREVVQATEFEVISLTTTDANYTVDYSSRSHSIWVLASKSGSRK